MAVALRKKKKEKGWKITQIYTQTNQEATRIIHLLPEVDRCMNYTDMLRKKQILNSSITISPAQTIKAELLHLTSKSRAYHI